MSNFSMTSYSLVLNSNLSVLSVKASDNTTVATYNLEVAYRLECKDAKYVIEATEMAATYRKSFTVSEGDSFSFSDADGIGISDLRIDCRAQYTYHLDECPLVLQNVEGVLLAQSPCTAPCTAPNDACCTIEVLEA
jgi:hypothetical protein